MKKIILLYFIIIQIVCASGFKTETQSIHTHEHTHIMEGSHSHIHAHVELPLNLFFLIQIQKEEDIIEKDNFLQYSSLHINPITNAIFRPPIL